MNIIIRVDSSKKIGTGHLMRCLSLSDALLEKSASVHFLCRDLQGNLNDYVRKRGHHLHTLPSPLQKSTQLEDDIDHADWLEVDWKQDIEDCKNILGHIKKKKHWLIIDHYALDYRWETSMRDAVDKLMVIDDIADRKHDCDILLDQNFFTQKKNRYSCLVLSNCIQLLGPRYALLRPEFRIARHYTKMRGNGLTRVLVYFGGNDHQNMTGKILKILSSSNLTHLHVEIVVGPHNSFLPQLTEQTSLRPNTSLHIQPDEFIELLKRSDISIGAGGATNWERICLGIPSIIITTAKNQELIAEELNREGYIYWIGRHDKVSTQKLQNEIESIIFRLGKQSTFSKPNLVDGYGCMRITEAIIPSMKDCLLLRDATYDDSENYYHWANDPDTRKNSFNTSYIPWVEHLNWFKNKIDSSKSEMYVLQTKEGLAVGQIRFDIEDGFADISYSLDPIVRRRNWGRVLLDLGQKKIAHLHGNITLRAKVKTENKISQKIFKQLGYEKAKHSEDYETYFLQVQ